MRVKLDNYARLPKRAHPTDAGLDIKTPKNIFVPARGSVVVDTGVHIELPDGTVGLLKSKSGLNLKHGITCEGVIDEGYTGSIMAVLRNESDTSKLFYRGDKICQLLIIPVIYEDAELAEEIEGGERGDNGFGSTGRR